MTTGFVVTSSDVRVLLCGEKRFVEKMRRVTSRVQPLSPVAEALASAVTLSASGVDNSGSELVRSSSSSSSHREI